MGRHRVQEATRKLDWFNQSIFLRPLVLRFDSFSQSIITSRRQKPERSASRRTRQASGPVSPGERNVMIFEIRSQRWRSRLVPQSRDYGAARRGQRFATPPPVRPTADTANPSYAHATRWRVGESEVGGQRLEIVRDLSTSLDMTGLWLRRSTPLNSGLPAPGSPLQLPVIDFDRGERRKFSEPGLCSRS